MDPDRPFLVYGHITILEIKIMAKEWRSTPPACWPFIDRKVGNDMRQRSPGQESNLRWPRQGLRPPYLSSKAKFKDNVTPINLACQDDKALM
ncbi:hypothetical protein CCH79_00007318 [Gambusia affinis]|uniref:Uncharacterized protein n=1 Tax=Gambusia affinis TaxID=33528 RepID=A0A315VC13_GAMAF|nr:hypothetical protein CCH79_00007318 [Gambusia affinis]